MNQGIEAKYKFLNQQMGSGNHSRIVQAQNIRTKQRVAVKILSPQLFKDNKQKAEKLIEQEIKILSRCENQNIIKYIEHFKEKKKIYLVVELAEETLQKYVQRIQPNESECIQILKQIGSGIFYLHQTAKAIHRDIRAENIMRKGDIWKILDLGFSKEMKNEADFFLSRFDINYYSAPEILENKQYNFKVDIWSLGILFYVMLFRKYPFDQKTQLNNIDKMKKQQIQFPVGTSDMVISFIKGCLKYDPQNRFSWSQLMNHTLIRKSSIINVQDLNFLILNKMENGQSSILTKKQFEQIFSEKDRQLYYNYIQNLNKILNIRNKVKLYYELFIQPAEKIIEKFSKEKNKFQCLLKPIIQASFYVKQIRDLNEGKYKKTHVIDQKINLNGKIKIIHAQFQLPSKIMGTIKQTNEYYQINQQKKQIKTNVQFYNQSEAILQQLDQIITSKIDKYSEKVVQIQQYNVQEYIKSINILSQKLLSLRQKITEDKDIQIFQILMSIIQELKKKENGEFLNSLTKREDIRKFEDRFKLQ